MSVGEVYVDLSISLDGFIAGPGDDPTRPLGEGGEALFAWMSGGPPLEGVDERIAGPPEASRVVVEEWTTRCGAIVSGRRTFDIAGGWADGHPIDVPIFVVTHEAPTTGDWSPQVRFVDDLDHGIELALKAAGDRDVSVCGADIAQQLLRAGRLDRIHVSVTPILLGDGVRLFDHLDRAPIALEQQRVIASDGVTHLRYGVVQAEGR